MINLLQLISVYIHLIKNLKIFIFKMLYMRYCYFFTKVKSSNILDIIIFIFNFFQNFLQVIGTLKTLIELWLLFSPYIYAAEILRFSSYYHYLKHLGCSVWPKSWSLSKYFLGYDDIAWMIKAQVNENITFRVKGRRTMALTNGIQIKTNGKESFRTIYSRIFILK